jgi:hypothetical protein
VADPRVNVMREVRRVPDRYVLIGKIRLVSSRKLRGVRLAPVVDDINPGLAVARIIRPMHRYGLKIGSELARTGCC